MAHPIVDQAFRAQLESSFSGCQIYPEGMATAPTDGSAFLVLQFPFSTSEQISVGDPGNNVYREEGAARFVLSVPRNRPAIESGRQWAAEIANLFRGNRFDGVLTFAPTSPVTDDENDTGSYYRLAWVCPYQFDLFG
ncbi:phage tail terminator-like protein [Mangrovibrevibacter kandeliae]|uniref:phage tail terminator-like protein n=1 Tax=Mangrovibrevibacter kandeliae TaxID=2968473 RepID=UPI0021195899|nr:phage tail terminator-like protein [Aurantimonas sp. CSK15Z-1]MCQ8781719.1 DUF4128 domain-containing protein [Aurantimonas sp. CSK15Z-1]